ncbi:MULTISPECIES: transferrin-binding protein-like solute binding protein [Rodentibacter]|uniref:transferrin-binding protein-like solute binding protein n=1 Tax=Rodentibacter TaxID=1960084 RepID=UPI001CFE4313|nr:transferrin-binding protein-like solute binding protein [Rodentibacter sp. JRC1]GJI55706.1 hypothetical protein HEMROJRC1_08180 [Rodentibacter sp. JRC1]
MNNLIKFSLTLVAAGILAACGSSGGSSNNAEAEKAAQQQAAEKAAAEKAAAEKAAAEKAAAEKAAAEAEALVKATEDVGAKFVKKNDSNLNVGHGTAKDSTSSDKVTGMTVKLHPSLDTIVVATPSVKGSAKQAYLEDFDFRGNVDNTSGEHTLEHIYKDKKVTLNVGTARADGESETKTATKGEDTGLSYVYEQDRVNYTHKQEGDDVLDTKAARTDAKLKGSVAEVYGFRTFLAGDSELKNEGTGQDATLANAPFTAKDTTSAAANSQNEGFVAGSQLHYVQYGRVTSSLSDVNPANLKEGKKIGADGTVVASFGSKGNEGTEDNYFYRGVNGTSYDANLANTLKDTYFGKDATGGTLNYRGHAVTYNLDRDFVRAGGIPNAIGYEQQLVSGTHVNANIDLATKQVTGNLYNTWEHGVSGSKEYAKVELASFNGNLANNGSISGTSTRTVDSAAGTFNASLFGAKATELGGAIASVDTTNNWGASFGAKLQNVEPNGPTPEAPTYSWEESTDQNNANNPLK